MENIIKIIFNECKNENIICFVWKGISKISDALEGKEDLDIYIPAEQRHSFEDVASRLGWFPLFPVIEYPEIAHYFYYSNGIFFHLHVYYQFRTGNSLCKDFELEIKDPELVSNVTTGVVTVSHELAKDIAIQRKFLKSRSLIGRLTMWNRRKKLAKEEAFLDLNSRSLPESVIRFRRLVLYSSLRAIINTTRRYLSIIVLRRRRKLRTGLIVGIVGSDGTGKSTLVEELFSIFRPKFGVVRLCVGRPSITPFTFPLWILRNFNFWARSLRKKRSSPKIKCGSVTLSKLGALRAISVAVERYAVIQLCHFYGYLGYLVIVDRVPSSELNTFDCPRISPAGNNAFFRWLSLWEREIYNSMRVDFAVVLSAPLSVLLARNASRQKILKEDDDEITHRYQLFQNYKPNAAKAVRVDATVPLADVVENVIEKITREFT